MRCVMSDTKRPRICCGKCPEVVSGGFDCTCAGNPRCPSGARCRCGHYALDHHGVDRDPHQGGCFGAGGWSGSRISKCVCTLTAGDVPAAALGIEVRE